MIELDCDNQRDLDLFRRIFPCPAEMVGHCSRYVATEPAPKQVSGRHLVVHFLVEGPDGRPLLNKQRDEFVTRRKRVKIPAGHPWRGRRVH